MKKLTKAQQKLLDDVRKHGSVVRNGRAFKTIEVLEQLGLVKADWDLRMVMKGNGLQGVWHITVKAIESQIA